MNDEQKIDHLDPRMGSDVCRSQFHLFCIVVGFVMIIVKTETSVWFTISKR